ncbi:uncharacterized protein Z520_10912 [Fonsecaea multimorphosa CBS 102226]|uniref:Glycosyl transferase family 25 domain-containing protein n=1 Tax=Fonsecaea multimorphosa CBS 102226 TaxID=1442371 RepID=A0A0D2JS54_9EURO|nr:uncharacterized protein Z520_10912 [Fonsecaea multimorphosa CBS 102226]KIX93269.1 hypothetical protein Z520_10912 [Fonsecaea multimorphosa CBS 102226]OAL18509.1 hypothetical protein AYO22_10486 [Fonsecaea multimorphosa]
MRQKMCSRLVVWLAGLLILLLPIIILSHRSAVPSNLLKIGYMSHSVLDDVRNSTLGFEKIFVISLPERSDKRDVWALAASQCDLSVSWVEGVKGEDIPIKAIPAGWNMRESNSTLGCYRGHLNAFQRIISDRLSSALIFEDDAEWDINIKSQLVDFARGLHYLQRVEKPEALHSPYGDDWDVLWLGYCGAKSRSGDHSYWITHDDPTVVPEPLRTETRKEGNRYLDDSAEPLQGTFTRVVTEPYNIRCLYAYAVSQRGARRFLYNYSIRAKARTADVAVSEFCSDGVSGARCFAPFPQFVDNYLAAGDTAKDSDRRQFHSEFRVQGTSNNIVFPAKTNLETFINNSRLYQSRWPDRTLTESINPDTYIFPRGYGVYLPKEQFKTPKNY